MAERQTSPTENDTRVVCPKASAFRWAQFRCDRTQVPEPGKFCTEQLEWFKNEAWIPKSRLVDFLKGEETRPGFNTCFKVQGTETRNEAAGIVEVRYWCSYGPRDDRNNIKPTIALLRKDRKTGQVPMRRTTEIGASFRRGCRWHFTAIFKYKDRPHDVLLRMHCKEHIDNADIICHGMHDPTAKEHCAHIAPRISIELRETIQRLVRTGVSPRGIMKMHREELRIQYRQEHPTDDGQVIWSRDMCLSLKDIHNVQREVNMQYEQWSSEDATGLKLWVQANGGTVLFYQEPDDSLQTPFIFVFATEWMMKKMATLGHNNAVALDGTFGTNQYGYELHTLLCFDDWQNGIPTCWALTQSKAEADLQTVLQAVKEGVERTRSEVLKLDDTWMPSAFLVDCADEEHNALMSLWPGVPIVLCLWHVRRAQYKNILKKIQDPVSRAEVNKDLGCIMGAIASDAVRMSEEFITRWKGKHKEFDAYYEKEWHHRVEGWVRNYRKFKHANQDTNGAVERWHATLKLHLRMEKPFKVGRKVVWLVTQLVNDLEHFFLCLSCIKWQGRVRNKNIENYVWSAILKARGIPESDVTFFSESGTAMVRSQTPPKTDCHILEKYDSEDCVCTCGSSIQGNICKHQVKVLTLIGMTEIDILHRFGTRFGSMLAPTFKFERPAFGERYEEVELPECFNVTLPMDNNDSEGEDGGLPVPKHSVQIEAYSDEQFRDIVEDALAICDGDSGVRSIAMTKLQNWRHDLKNMVARSARKVEAIRLRELKPFRVVNVENTQKRHLSFVDKIYRGRKRPLAKRKRQGNEEELEREIVVGSAKPFRKQILVKETTQQFLDRAAEEHTAGGRSCRRSKQKVNIMQDGTTGVHKNARKGKGMLKDRVQKLDCTTQLGRIHSPRNVSPLTVLDLNVPWTSKTDIVDAPRDHEAVQGMRNSLLDWPDTQALHMGPIERNVDSGHYRAASTFFFGAGVSSDKENIEL